MGLGNDMVMLARYELRPSWWTMSLPSPMGRTCLVGDVFFGGVALRVGAVHLESLPENADWRAKQLRVIASGIGAASLAIPNPSSQLRGVVLCGDVNFCD